MTLSLKRPMGRHGMGHPETSLRAKGTVARDRRATCSEPQKERFHCHVAYFVLWHLRTGKKSDESEQEPLSGVSALEVPAKNVLTAEPLMTLWK